MDRSPRTAVLAAIDAAMLREVPMLLAAADVSLEAVASGGSAALRAVQNCRPDYLIADVALPALNTVLFADVPVRPRMLILCRREFPVPDRAKLERSGAVFLAWPANRQTFCKAVRGLSLVENSFLPEHLNRVDQLLDALGVPCHPGRDVLRFAVLLCAQNEALLHGRRNRLYPMAAELARVAPASAERSMRYAIGAAWQSDKFDNQYRIFADTVDAGRGQPTCGEMIARLADILRLEG